MGLKSSQLKSPSLKCPLTEKSGVEGPGLKLWVKKSRLEMSLGLLCMNHFAGPFLRPQKYFGNLYVVVLSLQE